jgi:uncharacterized protein YfaS (alpha-2-macroglobulin family)
MLNFGDETIFSRVFPIFNSPEKDGDYANANMDADPDIVPDRGEHIRTLYWNPNVQTDKDGKAVINFYNSYFCKKIDISAEGITKEGIPITNK